MADIKIVNPEILGKPLGQYSHMTRVKASEFLFIAGQVGADSSGKAPEDFDAQCTQMFANIEAALKSAGVKYERHLYPNTQHGFNNDTTPRYDADAAKLAWQRTVDWFRAHVK